MIDEDNIHNSEFNLTEDFGLSSTDRAIADLYRGGSAEFTNNKKRCYMVLHPRASERTAEKKASELFKKPAMKRYLEIKAADVAAKATIDATRLIADAERLKRRCFGDEEFTTFTETQEDGESERTEKTVKIFDPTGVKNAIELQGKLIGAFSEKTIHSVDHDMNLEVEFVK